MKTRYEVVNVKFDAMTGEQKYFFSASRGTEEEAQQWIKDFYEGTDEINNLFIIEKTISGNKLERGVQQ